MEKQYLYLADVAGQLPEIPKNSVLSQSVLKEDKLDVTLFRFDAKQELTEHSSAYPAIVQALEGEATMTVGKDKVLLKPGSYLYMAPGLAHALLCKTPFTMLITLVK
jgi:quercetin dioxygenase-like cupin family protein